MKSDFSSSDLKYHQFFKPSKIIPIINPALNMHLWAKSGSPRVNRNIASSYESARQLIIPFRSPVARSQRIGYDLESPLKIQLPLPISHISKFKPWELIAEDDLFEQNSDFA